MKNGILAGTLCLTLAVNMGPASGEDGKSVTSLNRLHLISTEMKGGLFEKQDAVHVGAYPSFFKEASLLADVTLDYQMVPWARAVKNVEGSNQLLIFPLTRTPDREKKFSWVARLNEDKTCFASTGAVLNSLDDAKRRNRILAWRGSSYQTYLEGQGFKNLLILHDTAQVVRILNSDPEAAFYYPCDSAQSFLDASRSKIILKFGAPIDSEELWLAGGRHFKHTEASKKFAEAIGELEKSKTLNKLLNQLVK